MSAPVTLKLAVVLAFAASSTAFVAPETTNETVDADGGATAEFRKVTRNLSLTLTLTLSAALTLPVALTQGGCLRERCGEDTAQGPGRR